MRKPLIALLLAAAALHASAADLLQTVKARGTLKVAMEGVYPPFNFKEKMASWRATTSTWRAWWPASWG